MELVGDGFVVGMLVALRRDEQRAGNGWGNGRQRRILEQLDVVGQFGVVG